MSGRIWRWIRNLPQSRGRKTLLCLAMIMILGLGLRCYRVADPLATPSADSHAYYALSKALYVEGSYGGPNFAIQATGPRARRFFTRPPSTATGGPREGTARIIEALLGIATIVAVFFLGERLAGRSAGLLAALRGRHLPTLHPHHRGADERATGDAHLALGGARLLVGK